MTVPMRFRQYIQVKAAGECEECDPDVVCPADGWVKPEDAPPCADVDCPTNMNHHWKMDDSTSNVAEEKESFDMTAYGSGCTNGHTGVSGDCWKIDCNSGNYIKHSSGVDTDDAHVVPWTYSLWLKVERTDKLSYFLRGEPTTTNYLQPLFSFAPSGDGFILGAGFWFNDNLSRILTNYDLDFDTWYHVVLVFRYDPILEKVVGKLYIDGILYASDGTMSINGEPVGRTESFKLSVSIWGTYNTFYIDDIKVWHRELDGCEVWKLFLSYL